MGCDCCKKVNPADYSKWQKDMARWCNKRMIFTTCEFNDFSPRKGFTCKKYFEDDTLRL